MAIEKPQWKELFSEVVTSGLCTGCAACVVACPWTKIGSPIHRDERVQMGFYSSDTISELMNELEVTKGLLVKAFQSVPEAQLTKLFTYSPVTPLKVTILWAGAQAVHEAEHHLDDVQENLALLSGKEFE